MDRSLNRRPGIQTQSQTKKLNTFGIRNNFVARGQFNAPRVERPNTALLARRVPIDMSLPGEKESIRINSLISRNNHRRARRFITKFVASFAALILIFGGLFFSQNYLKLSKVFRGTTGTVAALKTNVNPSLLKGEGSGRVNILLLGRGGGNHDGPDLTDSMMVVSIDPVNKTAVLLSIPRDLWVSVPSGLMKINAAWEQGEFQYLDRIAPGSTNPKAIQAGFTYADQTVSQVLGIPIDYNLIVNFQAFQQAVSTLGGVTVNVPTELVDPTMAWENNNNPVLAQPGIQTFNGQQALNYVRSRETTSDFARAQRQRAVLEAIVQKALTINTLSNPLKVSSLLSTFGNNVDSDLGISNAQRLLTIIKTIGLNNIQSLDLDSASDPLVTTANISGQSVVIPAAGLFNYSQIQAYVSSQLKEPYLLKENAKVLILNGTSTPGLATNLVSELEPLGYNIIGYGNTPSSGYQNTLLIQLNNKDKYTNHFLEQRLNVTSQNSLPDSSIQTNGADFVIIIGSNESNPTQN